MTQYSREVSELGEFGAEPNDNGPAEPAEPDDDKTVTPPLGEQAEPVEVVPVVTPPAE